MAAAVGLALLVAFVLDNSQTVKVGFVFFSARLSLIWVLIIAAVLGAAADRLVILFRARRRARRTPYAKRVGASSRGGVRLEPLLQLGGKSSCPAACERADTHQLLASLGVDNHIRVTGDPAPHVGDIVHPSDRDRPLLSVEQASTGAASADLS